MTRSDDIPPGTRTDSGFTLLEMLVSLTLLALIVAALPGTLHLSQRALRTAGALDRTAVDNAAINFTLQKLSQAMPVLRHTDDGLQSVNFSGAPRTVSFVAPMLADGEQSGLYHFTLAAAAAASGSEHVQLSWRPYRTTNDNRDLLPASDSRVIVRRGNPFGLRYFGAVTGPAAWHDTWTSNDLPQGIELTYVGDGGRAKVVVRRIELQPKN